ncbi:FAD-linked oxidoreductase [Brachybacterium vulturis]|uniref:FAD-linked oxidoreductase n=2 Tax=Brachybacterium vulturis TaxID=2017484 RepID=A0A291GT82_9MICO|nr:FAD-linked oxidoreductase [Brachybacterium vulturis]
MRSQVQGQVLEPGEAGYDEVREVWNQLIDRYPLLIVRAASVADIPPVLEAARATGLPLAVRGGGHSNAGHGTVDDGIVLDLGELRGVSVDPATRQVTAAPGARTGDVDAATAPYRLAVPLGTVSTPGIAGMTLGGGVGWLVRSAGLALDRLVQAEVITADGQQLTASATEHPDLFWGLRGGGGNFGVVTSFIYEAVALPDPVLGATLFYRPAQWRRALAAFERWSRDLPDELTSILTVMVLPQHRGMGDEPWLLLRCTWVGEDEARGRALLERLCRAAPPDETDIGPISWPQWQSAADALFTDAARGFWRNTAFSRMDEDALDTITAVAAALPGRGTSVDIHHLGGAFARVPAQSTAFPNRSARFWMTVNGYWHEPDEDARFTAFAEQAEGAMKRLGEQGEYVNFRAREYTRPISDLTQSAYGEQTYRRLQQVKRLYDPGNLFRVNYNVVP